MTELQLCIGKVDSIQSGLSKTKSEIEGLQQYGRRNSLRFHNVPMTENDKQYTDEKVLGITNERLGVTLCKDDIQRSHIIGDIKDGCGQIICRFRNWKVKNQVYMAKRKLKGSDDSIFITEDLTSYRRSMIKHLSVAKGKGGVDSFWTNDGRVFFKRSSDNEKILVKNKEELFTYIPSEYQSPSCYLLAHFCAQHVY